MRKLAISLPSTNPLRGLGSATFGALALSATLFVGCRQVDELRPATNATAPATATVAAAADSPPPEWMSSERAVFAHVQQDFVALGLTEARSARLEVTEQAYLPSYQGESRAVYTPPFTDGVDRMRERIARMSARHFGGTLTFVDRFASAEEAYRGYRAFMTVALAHELWHHLQSARPRGAPRPVSIYDTESESIELEQAYLAREIAEEHVPATFLADYRRAVMAFHDAVPDATYASLPQDEKELRRVFDAAYLTYVHGETTAEEDGVNIEIEAGRTVLAGYSRKRIRLLTKGARALADFVTLAQPPR